MENENQEINNTPENKTTNVKTKKPKAPIIIAIVAIIAILGGVFACLYFFTDLFKSEKQLFVKELTSKQHVSEQLEEIKTLSKRMQEESYEATTKMTLDISGDEIKKEIKDEIGIDITKITLNENSKYDKNNTESNISLQYDNKDVIALDVIQKDDVIGIRVKDLYDKYLTIENKNLKDLVKKYGLDSEIDIDQIPDKILTGKDFQNALTITDENVEEIIEKYSKVFIEGIESEEIEKDKEKITIEINGDKKEFDTQKSVLELNPKQFLEASLKVVKELKKDDKTIKLVEDNIKGIIKLYEDNGYATEMTGIEDLDLKSGLDEAISGLEEVIKNMDEEDIKDAKIRLTMYSYDGKVIKNVIELVEKDKVFMSLEITSYKVDNTNYFEIAVSTAEQDKPIMKMYVIADQKENTSEKVKINYVIGMSMNVQNEIEFGLKYNIEQEVNFKSDVKITDLNSSNSLNLNTATESDLEKMVISISGNAMTYLVDLAEKFPELEPMIDELFDSINDGYNSNDVDYNSNNNAIGSNNNKVEIIGDTVVLNQTVGNTKIQHVFYYENDKLTKGVVTTTLTSNAEAEEYRKNLENQGLFDNFKVEGNVVTCDYSQDYISIYAYFDKEGLRDILNSSY